MVAVLLGVGLPACAPPSEGWSPPSELDVAALYAPHRRAHSAVRFFNPWDPRPHRARDLARWFVSKNPYGDAKRVPPVVPVVPNDGAHLREPAEGPRFTWVGHSTFAIHEGREVVLTDPHFGPRALVVPRETPPGIPMSALPSRAFAVVSHNHYDHLDAASVEGLPPEMQWFVPLGLGEFFRARGRRVVELDWWGSARGGAWKFTCLPSQHWSRRIGQGVNESLWCAWLIESAKASYFFAGDTGYFHGFGEYRRRFGPIDVAMLPIGAYEPRWLMAYQHLNPAEAYRAFRDLGARYLLAMHWGTFDLTDEPIDLPPRELMRVVTAARAEQERIRIFAVGETWELPLQSKTSD